MLVITRRIDQSILIDGGIKIMVVGFEPGRVKIGISAPKGIKILRSELVDKYGPRDDRHN